MIQLDTRWISFNDVAFANDRVDGFEDLTFLFNCDTNNRKIIRMDFDEAACLYKLAVSLGDCKCLEIGRWQGGSTFLLAAATTPNSEITSIDKTDIIKKPNSVNTPLPVSKVLEKALKHFNLQDKVKIIIDLSTNVKTKPNYYDLVFIDGDHNYKGVKADYEHWKDSVKLDGFLLFHDAVKGYGFYNEGVVTLIDEIIKEGNFKFENSVGSLVVLKRNN